MVDEFQDLDVRSARKTLVEIAHQRANIVANSSSICLAIAICLLSSGTFLILLVGVDAEPQLAQEFERRARLASWRLQRLGASLFAENKAPAPGLNLPYTDSLGANSRLFRLQVCRPRWSTFGKLDL